MRTTSVISVRMDSEEKEALKTRASKQNRTVSNYIKTLIKQQDKDKK